MSGSGVSYTAVYTVAAADVVSADGSAASIEVSFADLAGNVGTTVTSVTDDSEVTIDLTVPTLTSVTIVSDNAADTSRANAADTVKLVFAASESLVVSMVLVAGAAVSVVD